MEAQPKYSTYRATLKDYYEALDQDDEAFLSHPIAFAAYQEYRILSYQKESFGIIVGTGDKQDIKENFDLLDKMEIEEEDYEMGINTRQEKISGENEASGSGRGGAPRRSPTGKRSHRRSHNKSHNKSHMQAVTTLDKEQAIRGARDRSIKTMVHTIRRMILMNLEYGTMEKM
ncbi:hypothetical protein TWF481_010416 [Arthrobotrys musiformis]|uniref:Uncharacterized protein n=1 Tax=Arthrobotrys musiformis TaxID=47236 RepID=A0AAV9W234_9PEZI